MNFSNPLPSKTSMDTFLVWFNVINLYTLIPHEYKTKEALQFCLGNFPNDIPDVIRKGFIIEELKFIQQNNFFNFNDSTYRQISATEIGMSVALACRNLIITFLEIQIYEHTRLKFGDNFPKYLPTNWKCYLDDSFILGSHNLDKLSKFKNLTPLTAVFNLQWNTVTNNYPFHT